jgi:CRP-like cAMP-binding protein
VLAAQGIEALVVGQAESLALMTLVIFALVSVLFVTPRAGLVAVAPNLFPILALLGFMGYAGIPLDSATAIVGAIALGISVDDTLHFMVRYHQHTRRGASEPEALASTLGEELTPIASTSAALGLGFSVFALSGFPPVAHFGLLSALVMAVAVLSTLVLTPLMLAHFRLITLWDVLSLRLRREVLGGCPLFRGLSPGQTRRVVLLGEIAEVAEDRPVFRQGDVGDSVHIVLEGAVELWRTQSDHARERIAGLGPGAVFGEIALIARTPRTADVVAVRPTRLLTLRWDTLDRIARQYPRIASRLFRNLADVVTARLAGAEARSVLVRDADTGAFSLSYFREYLALELERVDRYGGPAVLVVLRCRATGAHEGQAADQERTACLRATAALIAGATRVLDVAARLTRDRLVLLVAQGGSAEAERVVARLRALFCAHGRRQGPDVPFEVALLERRDDELAEQLIERAQAQPEFQALAPCLPARGG